MEDNVEIQVSNAEIANIENIDMRVATAKKYPRDLMQIRNNVVALATVDQETAESCFYSLPKGDKLIEGPGIRFAEIIKSCWQHIRTASRTINVDKVAGTVTAEGACIDYENNISATVEEIVSIKDKYGKLYPDHLIILSQKRAQKTAERNAIFSVVPMAFFKSSMNEVKKVAAGENLGLPLADRAHNAFLYFEKRGIDRERILNALKIHDFAEVTEDNIVHLSGLKTALKEEKITLEAAFPITSKQKNKDKLDNTMNNLAK